MRGPVPAVLFAVLLVGVSCGGDGSVDDTPSATGSTVDRSEVVASTTTIPQMVINGWVQVGNQSFDMDFTCYSPGPGDVAAIGVGRHPDSGQPVEALIQGFLGQPYVGLTIGGSVRYEASLDAPLEVFVHDGTISAGAIEWLRGLDLDSGVGERIGYGAVFVSCGEYVHDLPEGY